VKGINRTAFELTLAQISGAAGVDLHLKTYLGYGSAKTLVDAFISL